LHDSCRAKFRDDDNEVPARLHRPRGARARGRWAGVQGGEID